MVEQAVAGRYIEPNEYINEEKMAKKLVAKKAKPLAIDKKASAEPIEKSIPDQIYEELIKSLKTSGEFDADSLSRLEILTANGGIRKSAEVIMAIKRIAEEEHATPRIRNQ